MSRGCIRVNWEPGELSDGSGRIERSRLGLNGVIRDQWRRGPDGSGRIERGSLRLNGVDRD